MFLCEGGKEYKALDRKFYDLPTTEEMIQCALETQEKIYAADPMVIDGCQTQVISETSDIAIYNSKGLDLTYSNKVSGLVVAAVVSDGNFACSGNLTITGNGAMICGNGGDKVCVVSATDGAKITIENGTFTSAGSACIELQITRSRSRFELCQYA